MVNYKITMKKIIYLVTLISIFFTAAGCMPYWESHMSVVVYPKGNYLISPGHTVDIGMSSDEVLFLLGKPNSWHISRNRRVQKMIYSNLLGGGRKVNLYFKDGRLEKIIEFYYQYL